MANKNITISNFPDIAVTNNDGNITGLVVDSVTTNNFTTSGNINLSNSNVNLGNLEDITILGGDAGQTIVTDGQGNLTWAAGGGGSPGGSNRYVQYNDDNTFGGSANFTYDEAQGTVSISRANIANANVGNIYMTGNISNVDYLDFDTQSVAADSFARMKWNSDYATMDVGLLNNVTLQLGQESHYYIKAGSAITNGRAVMFTGAQGDQIIGAHANSSVAGFKSRYIMGVATQDIAAGGFGYVTAFGRVSNINTFSYPEGSILYLTPNSEGLLQTTEPAAPNPKVAVAACLIQSNSPSAQNGRILVRPDEGYSLEDIQNVETTVPTNNDVLVYNGTSNVWQHRSSVPLANLATNANTVTNAAQPNITSVGTLTSLTISGNLDVDTITHGGSFVQVGNGFSFGQGANANLIKFSGNAGTQVISFYNTNANIKSIGQNVSLNDAVQIDSAGIYPTTTGDKYLGASAFRWGNIFVSRANVTGNVDMGAGAYLNFAPNSYINGIGGVNVNGWTFNTPDLQPPINGSIGNGVFELSLLKVVTANVTTTLLANTANVSGNLTVVGNITTANSRITGRNFVTSANGILNSGSGTNLTLDWTRELQHFTPTNATNITVGAAPAAGMTVCLVLKMPSTSYNVALNGVTGTQTSSGSTSFAPGTQRAAHLIFRSYGTTTNDIFVQIDASA